VGQALRNMAAAIAGHLPQVRDAAARRTAELDAR
jgi:hypothetical protein